MVTLSQMAEAIARYIEIHGDKEVTSVGTHVETYVWPCERDYSFSLADIYTGPIGTNPYTGRDELMFKGGTAKDMDPSQSGQDGQTLEQAPKERAEGAVNVEGTSPLSEMEKLFAALGAVRLAQGVDDAGTKDLMLEYAGTALSQVLERKEVAP